MAWVHFPLSSGDRVTAAAINELRTAILERQHVCDEWSPFDEVSAGDRVQASVLSAMRGKIDAIIDANDPWWLVSSYESPTSYSLKTLTRYSSSSTNRNVFQEAFGTGDTDWRHSFLSGGRLSVAAANDLYRVLDCLRTRKLTHGESPDEQRRRRKIGNNITPQAGACGIAVANADAQSWSENLGTAMSVPIVGFYPKVFPIDPPDHWAGSNMQVLTAFETTLASARSGYPCTSIGLCEFYAERNLIWYQLLYTASQGYAYSNLKRSRSIHCRVGTGTLPDTYAASCSYGETAGSLVLASGTKQGSVSGEGADVLFRRLSSGLADAGDTVTSFIHPETVTIAGCSPCDDVSDTNDPGEKVQAGDPVYESLTNGAKFWGTWEFSKAS